MRRDNSHHLVAAAQRRRADTLERARRALHELGETGQRHTVTQIAAHAGVSRSWLYAQPELRDQLRRLTAISAEPPHRHPPEPSADPTPRCDNASPSRTNASANSTTKTVNSATRSPTYTDNSAPTASPHPRHGHRPRHKHPAHAAKQATKPKITIDILKRAASFLGRSSTANTRSSRLHRRPPRRVWGRAHLHRPVLGRTAGGPEHVLRGQGPRPLSAGLP